MDNNIDQSNNLDYTNGLNSVQPQPMPTVESVTQSVQPQPMPTVESVTQSVQPQPMPTVESVTQSVQPQPMPTVESVTKSAQPQPMPTVESVAQSVQPQSMSTVESQVTAVSTEQHIDKVANLNKEDVMEEALSHTNQFTPFETPKQEINSDTKKASNKAVYIFIGVILLIMALFIYFLPQISKLFGW